MRISRGEASSTLDDVVDDVVSRDKASSAMDESDSEWESVGAKHLAKHELNFCMFFEMHKSCGALPITLRITYLGITGATLANNKI